jgi:hypothetical protein
MSDRRLKTLLAIGAGRPLRGRQRALAHELEKDEVLMRALEHQRRVVAALKAGGPAPSTELAARLRQAADGGDARQPGPTAAARWRTVTYLTAAAATALVAIAVIVAWPFAGSSMPTAARVSRVWTLPGTGTPVTAAASDPSQLDASYHGIAFPNYHDSEGWHPVGLRRDRIGTLETMTVVYATGNRRATYTVVPATHLAVPARASRQRIGGLRLRVFRTGDRYIVTFEKAGNTCVLTAAAPRERQWLIRLATWHGGPATSPV